MITKKFDGGHNVKNKRDRLFFTQLFVPQAPQSSQDRRAELEVLLAVPSAQSACGMEIKMSQQKVDRYKQEKAHRKERLEKEKKRKKLLRICSYFVLAVIVLAIAFAIYRHYTPKTETPAETETTVESVIETTTVEESATGEGTVEESTAVETEDADTESTSEETADIESAVEETDAAGTESTAADGEAAQAESAAE